MDKIVVDSHFLRIENIHDKNKVDESTLKEGRTTSVPLPSTGRKIRSRGEVENLVISLMRSSEYRHTTPERLNATMLAMNSGRVSISTFQRAFWKLVEQGVLHRISVPGTGANILHFYELDDQPRHLHLFCTVCRQFEEIFDASLVALHDRVLRCHHLVPGRPASTLLGTCAACQQKDR